MGLDLTGYRQVTATLTTVDWDDAEAIAADRGWVNEYGEARTAYVNPHFPGSAEVEGGPALIIGPHAGVECCRAGSYGGYNQRRAVLSRTLLGAPPEDVWADPSKFDHPIVHLVNFSDSEGVIGPKRCAAIAGVFADPEAMEKFIAAAGDPYAKGWWDDMRRVFEAGADDGLVSFH